MFRSVYNYLRWGYTRNKAETVFGVCLEGVVEFARSDLPPDDAERPASQMLDYAQSMASLYPDLTVKYAAQVMALIPDTRAESVPRAIRMIFDNAKRANRIAPETVQNALKAAVPFAAEYPTLKYRVDGAMEMVGTKPDDWKTALARTSPRAP